MKINRLSFRGYRNLKDDEVFPGNEVNIIYGDNAQGKTNLIELMWLFTGGKSFRGAKDKEIIKFSEKKAELCADFFSQGRNQSLRLSYNALTKDLKKEIYLNGVYKKASSMIVGNFCAVVFSPTHLSLIKNGPNMRRKFIDTTICQSEPAYTKVLARYNRALTQRNALVKDCALMSVRLDDMIDVWDSELLSFGKIIIEKRRKYCEFLQEEVKEIYKRLSENSENIDIRYELSFECGENIEESFRKSLKSKRDSDIKYGFTSVGPHRDDIDIRINSMSAKKFASQGQQRFIVLALKLSEAKILERKVGEKPVILLDDVLSELDTKRQEYLINNIEGFQVFISCCEVSELIKKSQARCFRINGGVID